MEVETEKQEGRTAAGLGSRSSAKDTLKPRRAIRRYDIFAEYNRLERLDKGMDEPHAKDYGPWVAKVFEMACVVLFLRSTLRLRGAVLRLAERCDARDRLAKWVGMGRHG